MMLKRPKLIKLENPFPPKDNQVCQKMVSWYKNRRSTSKTLEPSENFSD